MGENLPKFRIATGENIGNELFFLFPDLSAQQRTYLTADVASGVTALSADGVNFSIGQFIVIGQPGNITTEIVQIHASTVPTATTITLAAATLFAHNRGDIVRFIPYNQIKPEWATSQTGSFTALSPVTIRSDSSETYLQEAADPQTYWYRYRFYNSSLSSYSLYSDVISAMGYADNTIWSVKRRALRQMGEKYSDLITDQDLNDWLQEGRRAADQNPAVFRWSFRTQFNNITGPLLAGQWRVPVPANLRDPNSPKNILSIRPANQNRPCVYQDRRRFNQNYLNIQHSTVSVQAIANATTLTLANTADFSAAGALTLANNTIGDGLIQIAYTANNQVTGVLSGVTGINRTVLVGTDAWQNSASASIPFGLPTAYTLGGDGYIYFDVPMMVKYDGMNVKDDHYTTIPTILTDDQTFDEPFWDLYVSWLKWKIKYKKANGKIDRDGDPDYKDWITGLGNLFGQEFPGQRTQFVPDVEGFISATE